MSDDEETTVWQRVKRPRLPAGVESDRRGHQPATIADALKWLPLAIAVVGGVAGYTRLQADVEVLRRDMDSAIRDAEKQHDKIDSRIGEIWRRVGSR